MSTNIFWDNNSHLLTLSELKTLHNDAYANAATVTATMYTTSGQEVGNVTWPLAMAEDGSLTGTYTCMLPADCDVDDGDVVDIVISAADGVFVGEWHLRTRVKTRTA